VKELTCLYGIARIAARQDLLLAEILQSVVELLPPAWLYPDIASGRIIVDGQAYTTPGFQDGVQKQSAEIIAQGKHRGSIEVTYSQEMSERDEGPFLKEERNLIDTVAREVALIIERRQAEEEKAKLQDQLRHADRLATIGQLAAGVAHELNEPLGNILGFAQLALKCADLPEQARKDIDRIASASLYTREVIRKLMLFARQMPSSKTQLNLNHIVEEGLGFFEARCSKADIHLIRRLHPSLPEIDADPSQMTQILVNLVVNAIHAMPRGGELVVQTLAGADHVSLVVEDMGVGMNREVMSQIFIPFFTTKDVNEGTGLGLPVTHGIVTAHGGSIHVSSEIGRGSRFEVRFPLGGLQQSS
jgi:signal transduction histidine kinase